MRYEVSVCSKCDCGGKRPIVNRRHWLCDQKNKERLGRGQKYSSSSNKLNKSKPKQSHFNKPIKRKSVKKQSTKGLEIQKRYIETIQEIDSEREPICDGCGRYQGGEVRLSHSHVISRQQCHNIGKPELIYDKKNIRLHCLDFGNHKGCHTKWEHPTKKKELLDFERNSSYIKTVSIDLYNKLCQDVKG